MPGWWIAGQPVPSGSGRGAGSGPTPMICTPPVRAAPGSSPEIARLELLGGGAVEDDGGNE